MVSINVQHNCLPLLAASGITQTRRVYVATGSFGLTLKSLTWNANGELV